VEVKEEREFEHGKLLLLNQHGFETSLSQEAKANNSMLKGRP
jgi:hypothetical protein